MNNNKPLRVDNSMLSSVAQCPLQAALRYSLHFTKKGLNKYLESGTAIHKGIEAKFQGYDNVSCLQIAGDYYHGALESIDLDGDDRYTAKNILEIINRWLESNDISRMPFQVKAEDVEVGFEVPLCKDINYVGILDLYGVDMTHGWSCIIDIKSTGKMDKLWERKWRWTSQLTGYLYAANMLFRGTEGTAKVLGAYILGVEVKEIPRSSRMCKEHSVKYEECGHQHLKDCLIPTTRSPEEIAHWYYDAVSLATRFRDIKTHIKTIEDLPKIFAYGIFNDHCRMCEFQDYCLGGRQKVMLESMYEKRVWDPIEGIKVFRTSETMKDNGVKESEVN